MSEPIAPDPVAAHVLRYGAQWWAPLLLSAKLILEAVTMRRVLAAGMSRMGFPPDQQAPHRMLASGAGSTAALDQADRMLALVAETHPDEFRAHFWRGVAALERGDAVCALPHLDRAAAWFSGSALAFLYAARIERKRHWRGRETPRLAAAVAAAPDLSDARRRLADLRRPAEPAVAAAHYLALAHGRPVPLHGRTFREAQAEAQDHLAHLRAEDHRREIPLIDTGTPFRIRPLRPVDGDLGWYEERALDAALRNPPTPLQPADREEWFNILPLYDIGYQIIRWRRRYYAVDWHIRVDSPHQLESTPERAVYDAATVGELRRILAGKAAAVPFGGKDQSRKGGSQP